MTRHQLLVALGAAAAGMVVTSGVLTWTSDPPHRVANMAGWAFLWCLVAGVVAACCLYWWEDEPDVEDEP